METCDDCRQEYEGPAYYTFDPDGCEWRVADKVEPHDCTGTLCPECAGPFLEPDQPGDPRRPIVDFYAGAMEVS